MNKMSKYRIPVASLKDGTHEFEFTLNGEFFGSYDGSIIRQGNLDVLVTVKKKNQLLEMDFTLEGEVEVDCDRCGDALILSVASLNELIVKLGESEAEKSDDIVRLSAHQHELDVAQYLYEFASLTIPMRKVHDDMEPGQSACNKQSLEKLTKLTHQNEPEEKTDPRWDGLKNINLN